VNPLAYERRDRSAIAISIAISLRRKSEGFRRQGRELAVPAPAQHEVLLDLHSTRAKTQPFAMLGRATTRTRFNRSSTRRRSGDGAAARVTRFVDGWWTPTPRGLRGAWKEARQRSKPQPDLRRCTTEYMRSVGGYAVTLECGQHDDPSSGRCLPRDPQRLAHLGISTEPATRGRTLRSAAPRRGDRIAATPKTASSKAWSELRSLTKATHRHAPRRHAGHSPHDG